MVVVILTHSGGDPKSAQQVAGGWGNIAPNTANQVVVGSVNTDPNAAHKWLL